MGASLSNRDLRIDILRVVGLLLIILAHVSPPFLLFQFRTFDVPLMVFVSGLSYLAAGKNNVGFISYVLSRVKRLLFPLWCFLTLFFLLVYLFGAQNILNINFSKVFYSYAMLGGIGYVWVIRIFLMIAILSPLYVGLSKRLNDGQVTFCSYAVILISSVLVMWVKEYTHGVVLFTFTEVIIPAVSYGVLFIIGCRFNSFSIKYKVIFFMLGMLSIILIEVFSIYSSGKWLFPQDYKYPPSYLYVFYSFALIPVFYLLSNCLAPKFKINVRARAILVFISSNTIWIYFLHIPVVEFFRVNHILDEYYIKWVLAFIIPCLLYTLQYKLITLLAIKIKNKSTAQFLKRTFTG
ncbi:fucose 4-O-acetylase-like acetyltransferase [Raoultella sp. BIGb0149]|uniref:acyltransferase family protein n=1 Tax=Raoultella sp. BIGb0149 TaxID=2485116 RepID=UPI00105B4356|nr:acyltransferase family protein [Raoultella sp. BIGb0149]TDQ24886.1 fucose 4-O-acetylase-like acetyltransferase [Raoultella sp. BIGb0149]